MDERGGLSETHTHRERESEREREREREGERVCVSETTRERAMQHE